MAEQTRKDREDDAKERHARETTTDVAVAVLREHLKNIDANTSCLPMLCKTVERHEVQIDAVTKAHGNTNSRLWGLVIAIVIGLLAGTFALAGILLRSKL